MEILFTIILVIHITGGTLSLAGAPVALAVHKGGKAHRIAGQIFLWGMTVVFVTAVYMSIAHSIPFLFMVGFFSYQLVLSGYRALFYKKLFKGQVVKKLDWLIVAVAALVNPALMVWGAWQWTTTHNTLGIVAIVFGLLGFNFVYRDFTHFRNGSAEKNTWLFKHISGMIAGYIAAVTAFLVVNFSDRVPTLIVWLGPVVVGIPLITYYVGLYKKKLGGGRNARELVTVKIATNQIT